MTDQVKITNGNLYAWAHPGDVTRRQHLVLAISWLVKRLEIETPIEIVFNKEFCDKNDIRGASNEMADGSYMMVLDPLDSDVILVLCHEFVHLWQLEFEKLRYIKEDDIHYWEGRPHIHDRMRQLPWEAEADKLESVLYAELEKALPR